MRIKLPWLHWGKKRAQAPGLAVDQWVADLWGKELDRSIRQHRTFMPLVYGGEDTLHLTARRRKEN